MSHGGRCWVAFCILQGSWARRLLYAVAAPKCSSGCSTPVKMLPSPPSSGHPPPLPPTSTLGYSHPRGNTRHDNHLGLLSPPEKAISGAGKTPGERGLLRASAWPRACPSALHPGFWLSRAGQPGESSTWDSTLTRFLLPTFSQTIGPRRQTALPPRSPDHLISILSGFVLCGP
jgi:hypothetical protein